MNPFPLVGKFPLGTSWREDNSPTLAFCDVVATWMLGPTSLLGLPFSTLSSLGLRLPWSPLTSRDNIHPVVNTIAGVMVFNHFSLSSRIFTSVTPAAADSFPEDAHKKLVVVNSRISHSLISQWNQFNINVCLSFHTELHGWNDHACWVQGCKSGRLMSSFIRIRGGGKGCLWSWIRRWCCDYWPTKNDNKFHEFYDNLYQFQVFMDRDKAFSQDVDLGILY